MRRVGEIRSLSVRLESASEPFSFGVRRGKEASALFGNKVLALANGRAGKFKCVTRRSPDFQKEYSVSVRPMPTHALRTEVSRIQGSLGPNQPPDPTPTSGTSAAEQPRVPAAVVAHL